MGWRFPHKLRCQIVSHPSELIVTQSLPFKIHTDSDILDLVLGLPLGTTPNQFIKRATLGDQNIFDTTSQLLGDATHGLECHTIKDLGLLDPLQRLWFDADPGRQLGLSHAQDSPDIFDPPLTRPIEQRRAYQRLDTPIQLYPGKL